MGGLAVRVTERIEAVRPDGTLEASRLYSNVKATGKGMEGVGAISGKRDRYLVGKDELWTPRTLNTELGFPDFPYAEGPVPVGATWGTNGNLREVRARLKEIREIAGRRAAVIDFLPNPNANSKDTIGPNSYWVLDLADGRPLFARVELIDATGTGAFTLVRRDVPGLVPKL